MRLLWATAGWVAFSLGIAGTVLPVVPTVPFLLLAAFCFARSSPRLHNWLMTHPRFGGPLRDWEANHAIGRRVKIVALAMMAAGLVPGLLLLPLPLWLAQVGIMVAAGTFVATRPEPPPAAPGLRSGPTGP